jgi:hypothetical protein
MRRRFGVLAALLFLLVLAGMFSVPLLQRCCPDSPLPAGWPNPPPQSLLDRLFFMDMVPRLAALAAVAGSASLVGLAAIYGVTAKAASLGSDAGSLGYAGVFRAFAAAFVVGVLYLYGLFVTGYFQLGWFNLVWIFGVPALLAALTGKDEFERRWGGLFLIIPGFVFEMALMMALGIDY